MSTIATVGNSASAWSDLTASRAASRKDRMFAKADANGDGKVDTGELQTMLDKVASKTGTTAGNAADLMSSLDTDGSGALSSDELSTGMKSLMPAPSSTVDFAQNRSSSSSNNGADSLFASLDADSSGGLSATELNKLLDQYAANATGSTASGDTAASDATGAVSGTSATSSDSVTAAAESAVFKQLDTDGDGTISKAEFDNAASGTEGGGGHRMHGHGGHGGMPPPDDLMATAGTSASDSSSSSGDSTGTSTTATDPLDTNGDGVVSSAELAAGQFNDLVSSLGAALDNSSTGSLSASQADAYKRQFDAAIASMSAATSGSGSGASPTTGTAAAQDRSFDMSALADLAMRRYTQTAASDSQASSLSIAA